MQIKEEVVAGRKWVFYSYIVVVGLSSTPEACNLTSDVETDGPVLLLAYLYIHRYGTKLIWDIANW